MKVIGKTTCLYCGNNDAIIIQESRYNGLRGICDNCEGNWPES